MPPTLIRDQIETALASNAVRGNQDRHARHARGGGSGRRELCRCRNEVPIVLDPVLAASSGRSLLDDDARVALVERLFPRVTLITPNIPEAAALLGEPESRDPTTLTTYGVRLLADGPRAVLIKGGCGAGDESVDDAVFRRRG